MFFSAKELHKAAKSDFYLAEGILNDMDCNYDGYDSTKTPSLVKVRAYVKACKEAIVKREETAQFKQGSKYVGEAELYKWFRPWDIVPKLKNWQAPAGDYGVGIEIEHGFRSNRAASKIVEKIKNWRHIAVDIEGGEHPIEATFPPFEYSKMNSRRQPFRYLKVLRDNSDLLFEHEAGEHVGIHVNVSVGGGGRFDRRRVGDMRNVLSMICAGWDANTTALCNKYFGRKPYGYCNDYSGKYVEYKLFNSTTKSHLLRRYIHIAVALTELINSSSPITETTVLEALEKGYNKR